MATKKWYNETRSDAALVIDEMKFDMKFDLIRMLAQFATEHYLEIVFQL